MKTLKLLLVAFAISISTNSVANSDPKFFNEGSIASEVSKILEQKNCTQENDFVVTLFFSISEDKKIQNISVASSNEELNQFLAARLTNQELPGDAWRMGKIYELSIVQKARA